MKRLLVCLFAATLGLAMASSAWAGPVTYSYDWTPSNLFIAGDGSHNLIDFSNQGGTTVTGPTDGAATNISVDNNQTDTFTNIGYTLKVKLTDGANTGTLVFNGTLNGTVTSGVPSGFSNTFVPPTSQSLDLGSDHFVVSMNGFVPPNPFGGKPGGIGFHIDVNGGNGTPPPPPPTNDTPEPSTVLLSLLGIGGLGLKAWRKTRLA
jgi:hypothetical protein